MRPESVTSARVLSVVLSLAGGVVAGFGGAGSEWWVPAVPTVFAQDRSGAASEVVMPLRLEKERLDALRAGTLDSKERKTLAVSAFSRYLSEYLKGTGAAEAKADAFTQKALKEFSKYVPSWRVEIDPAGAEPRAVFSLATTALLADLEKEGFRAQANANGLFNSAPLAATAGGAPNPAMGREASGAGAGTGAPSSGTPASAKSVPYAAFLVDERSREVWVVPPEALASYALDTPPSAGGAPFRFRPAATLKAVAPTDTEVNSVASTLATRAAQFSNKVLYHLQLKNLVFKPEWTKQVLAFFETSAQVGKARGETRAWPPALPWSLSTLHSNSGLVAVFTVRSDDKAGVLERVEIVGSNGGKLLRQYWSRAMHDPAYQDTAARAIEKAATAFSRLHRVRRPDPAPSNLGFWVDKRVSEKDVLALENILRSFALGEDALLVPTDVTKDDVRYRTPVAGPRADKVLERLRGGLPGVTAKLASGEPPVILLSPKTGAKPSP